MSQHRDGAAELAVLPSGRVDRCVQRAPGRTRRQEIPRNLAVSSQEHGSDTRGFVRLASGGKTRTLEELIGDPRQG